MTGQGAGVAWDQAGDEPINGPGDGNTTPDWQIVDDLMVQLRAERAGGGSGRIYTLTVRIEVR